jgi:hypothetical protein
MMQFGQYMKELFSDAKVYIPSGKQLGTYLLAASTLVPSGCHRNKREAPPAADYHGLEVGERLVGVDAWVENQENPHTGNIDQSYVYVSFAGSGSPPGTADTAKNSDVALIGFYAGSPKDAEKMAYRLERSTMEIKNIEPKSFHLMYDGSWMYLSDNDDVLIRKTALEGTNPELPKVQTRPGVRKHDKTSNPSQHDTVIVNNNNYYRTIEKHYIHERPKVVINNNARSQAGCRGY